MMKAIALSTMLLLGGIALVPSASAICVPPPTTSGVQGCGNYYYDLGEVIANWGVDVAYCTAKSVLGESC